MYTLDIAELAGEKKDPRLPLSLNDPKAKAIMESLEMLKADKARIYRTWVYSKHQFCIVTTSKDIHLGIGRLPEETHGHLCELIWGCFEDGGAYEMQLLLILPDDRSPILVSHVGEFDPKAEETVLNFSPA